MLYLQEKGEPDVVDLAGDGPASFRAYRLPPFVRFTHRSAGNPLPQSAVI